MLHLIIALVLMGRNTLTGNMPSEEVKREQNPAPPMVGAQDYKEGLLPGLQSCG